MCLQSYQTNINSYPDGQDWHDHCSRWSAIDDGIYRGNCLGLPNETLLDSLKDRGFHDGSWIYYCGDHKIPDGLANSAFPVHAHGELLSDEDLDMFLPKPFIKNKRDLWALIDFFVCRNIPTFVGNSVSTFSALQILIRNGANAYWYNSGSIPLAMILKAYPVPLVYTYTELSKKSGKFLLQASITSAKKIMPNNPIHMIYHGTLDKSFRIWLHQQNVTIHNHDPVWREDIETMRKNGNTEASHLFLHEGKEFQDLCCIFYTS